MDFANKFSVLIVVGERRLYYCTIYRFYVSTTFVFLIVLFIPASVSICLDSAWGWLPLSRSCLASFPASTARASPQSPQCRLCLCLENNASTTSLGSLVSFSYLLGPVRWCRWPTWTGRSAWSPHWPAG